MLINRLQIWLFLQPVSRSCVARKLRLLVEVHPLLLTEQRRVAKTAYQA